MDPVVYDAFRLLQQKALTSARHRSAELGARLRCSLLADRSEVESTSKRLREVDGALSVLLDRMDDAQACELRIARAMFLRMLLRSAAARLGSWVLDPPPFDLPRSHRFEFVAHEYETRELAEIESAMTTTEAALYARVFAAWDDIYE